MNNEDITFSDFLPTINDLGKGEWTTMYASKGDADGPAFYSAMMREDLVEKALKDASWDLHIGDGAPGLVTQYELGNETTWYSRPTDEGIEPFALKRHFHGIRPTYWEIAEDFRLYFNLYEDHRNKRLLKIDENGDEHEAVQMSPTQIRVKTRLLKEYLGVRKMRLVLYFDYNRLSTKSLEELGIEEHHAVESTADQVISKGARPWIGFSDKTKQTHGFLMGKKILSGDTETPRQPFSREDREYEGFLIGVDDDGHEIKYTCDEGQLANYFGKNPGSPHYLTPVFFRKEVLNKYYSQPEKYTITDGYLTCAGMWSLQMDNNQPDSVMVFLGDLGHLAHIEQKYWRGFNISSGKMSRTAFERSMLGRFADAESVDFLFKQRFELFNNRFKKKFGWELFKPLVDKDEYYLKILRVPLTNEQREFDEQVLALTKVFIDSLNEKELARGITQKENAKGLDKLEAFLKHNNGYSAPMMEFLRKLQALRSACSAHRKGDSYEKLKPYFEIDEKELTDVLEDILSKCLRTLNTLDSAFQLGIAEEITDYST
jgi:hypothetical protein